MSKKADKIGAWSVFDAPVPMITGLVHRDMTKKILFLGDLHLDNPKADRGAVKILLDEAVSEDAAIVLLGDTFDVMQGRNDRRSAKAALREQYIGRDDYLTAVLEDVRDFLIPYAPNLWMILDGNHESAITKYNEVAMTKLLVHELRREGSLVVTPGYQTYAIVGLRFTKSKEKQNYQDMRIPFWVSHGTGGGGQVTKGVIQAQRRAVTYPDARFVVSGHIHTSYFVAHEQHRITKAGFTYDTEQEHYVVGSWKDEHSPKSGYHVERGRGPTLPSGWWAEFSSPRQVHNKQHDRGVWRFSRAIP